MKLKIKVKRLNKDIPLPHITEKGDWIDLRAAETVVLDAPQSGTLKTTTVDGVKVSHRDVTFDNKLIKLGVAMQLPKGFEAVLLPRSSTYIKFGIIAGNSEGVIDQSYCGDNDEWKFSAIALENTTIKEGDRICQFRIQPSQKATMWQKLRWLLSSGVKIVEVKSLSSHSRGGFGTTGIK